MAVGEIGRYSCGVARPARHSVRGQLMPRMTTIAASQAGPDHVDAFPCGASRAMRRVSQAVARLIASMPQPIANAAELERTLAVSKKLAWQIYRIATAAEPLAAASFLPGADPVRKLLDAAKARRLPAAV